MSYIFPYPPFLNGPFFLTIYSSVQIFFLTLVGWGQSTARMASSNTVFRPRWVKAEHSRYFTESENENKDILLNKYSLQNRTNKSYDHLQRRQRFFFFLLLAYLLGQSQALRVGDGCQLFLFQLLDGLLLIPQIQLGTHQDDRCGGAMVADLREPLSEDEVREKQNELRGRQREDNMHRKFFFKTFWILLLHDLT